MNGLFDNIVWHTLCGPHAEHAVGSGGARRYARGFTPFVAFANPAAPDLAALAGHVEPEETLYCDGWSGAAPAGWRIESEEVLCRMVWDTAMPFAEELPGAILLDARHASAALKLATLANPGPFASRSIELGDYLGIFEDERLIAMAGARACAGGFREISSVCTHPDFRGKGLAGKLVRRLIRQQMLSGELLFLRVMQESRTVRGFYRNLGFRDYRDSVARTFAWHG